MRQYRSIVKDIRGPLAPIMPAFHDDESLDIASTCRWVNWMIGKGIKLFWTTYGTTHYACLSDAEVMDLTKALGRTISGRGVFIASTALHWPAGQCRDFVQYAADYGASIVKVQINWFLAPDDNRVFEHYSRIAESSPLPLFAYSLAVPGISGGISSELLKRILTLPQFVGLKNDKDDFYGQADYLSVVRECSDTSEFAVVTGGSMSSYLFGYDFGQRAFGDVMAWFAPPISLAFSECMDQGKREEAVRIIKAWQEPTWEQWKRPAWGAHYNWARTALRLMGLFESNAARFPMRPLQGEDIESVRRFLDEKQIRTE